VSSKVQTNYAKVEYQEGDSFLFGPETRGLPQAILDRFKGITLPMQAGSRSLNLSAFIGNLKAKWLNKMQTDTHIST
jgi:tRNA (cytidine/uridine-2'-O-)-methyltransferase